MWNYDSYHGLCPTVAQFGASSRNYHRPLLPPVYLVSRQLKKVEHFFFFDWLSHCHTSPGDVYRLLGEDDIRFLFC